jgi:hypothetical protein
MNRLSLALGFAVLLACALAFSAQASAPDDPRFRTSRPSPTGARELQLPDEEDGAFTFAVFGDRTGGPAEGVTVLAQAVRETNLLAPDLVMTVGDLVEGYNTTPEWLVQAAEFRGIMNRLACPWFPVPGNHDMYWRGPGRPPREHEASYERVFGPLWYAFRHKRCWFIALFADETNPETGEKRFDDAAHQRMSPEQFAWLQETLAAAAGARHVFVFLHHPRWIGGRYGDDWERVHRLLVDAGNVTAVFAGHIHHMRSDPRDGIEYFALATVGGAQAGDLPDAGYLHQYSFVTVRDDGIATVSYPVGAAQDPRAITGEVSMVARRATNELRVEARGRLELDLAAGGAGVLELVLANPLARPVEIALRAPDGGDPRWRLSPEHAHLALDAGATRSIALAVERLPGPIDAAFSAPRVTRAADVLFDGLRVPLPDVDVDLPVAPRAFRRSTGEHVLALDGTTAHATVPSASLVVPDGPFTVEAWMNADALDGPRGLVAKTESSEFGLFVGDGKPAFQVHLDGRYARAAASAPALATGAWHHVAGVFDGARVAVFVDGREVAATTASGTRTTNALPLVIGGDVDGRGRGRELFRGRIDDVRISRGARYTAPFAPARDAPADADTLLLLSMEGTLGPWVEDASARAAHAELRGGARVNER